MFELYKRIIGGELRKNYEGDEKGYAWVKDVVEPSLRTVKLFLRPENAPVIEKVKGQKDSIYCPYQDMWIEPFLLITEGEKEIKENALRGACALFFRNYYVAYKKYHDIRYKSYMEKYLIEHDKKAPPEDIVFSEIPDENENEFLLIITWFFERKDNFISQFVIIIKTKDGDILKIDCPREVPNYAIDSVCEPVLSFLRFINLSNIKLEANSLDRKTKKHIHRNKSRQTHYHILTVTKPSFQKKSVKEQSQSEKIALPLHQVRGHLADYSQGKGLFGKYNIRIWVPDHWRGDIEYGKINKDYKVKSKFLT